MELTRKVTVVGVGNLADVAELEPRARLQSLATYIADLDESLVEARGMRDQSIRDLRAQNVSRPEVARLAGVSVPHVANVASQSARRSQQPHDVQAV
jgi:hypothetical protein